LTADTAIPPPVDPAERAAFEARLRGLESRYHIHHPFNRRMAAGQCSPEQIRGWVASRFYYQINIPLKDAAILSNCPDRATRREWVVRILDHDGTDGPGGQPGGIEAWTRLGEAVGLSREVLWSQKMVLPGVRFAVDAYVNFARRAPCTSSGWRTGPSTTRGSTPTGWPTSARVSRSPSATWSMACA